GAGHVPVPTLRSLTGANLRNVLRDRNHHSAPMFSGCAAAILRSTSACAAWRTRSLLHSSAYQESDLSESSENFFPAFLPKGMTSSDPSSSSCCTTASISSAGVG